MSWSRLAVLLLVTAACGGRTTVPVGTDAAGDGGTVLDAAVEASFDAPPMPTKCHDLANTAKVVNVTKGTPGGGSPPVGPPPPPGIYTLGSALSFAPNPPKTLRETVRVRDDGETFDVILEVDGGPSQIGTYRLDASDPGLDVNLLPTCGPLPALRVRFLALSSTPFALEVRDPSPGFYRFF